MSRLTLFLFSCCFFIILCLWEITVDLATANDPIPEGEQLRRIKFGPSTVFYQFHIYRIRGHSCKIIREYLK